MTNAWATAAELRADAVKAERAGRGNALAIGLSAIALFFGGLGAAAAFVPLDSAVIGQGSVIVTGRSETIASVTGGRVLAVLVAEGDEVRRGDLLVRLDTQKAAGEVAAMQARRVELEAQRAQLLAADGGAEQILAPGEWQSHTSPDAAGALQRRQSELDARQASLRGSLEILDQRQAQIAEQLVGLAAQRVAVTDQAQLADEEIETAKGLIAKGLTTLPRLRQAEGLRAQLTERLARIDAESASLGEKQSELELEKSRLRDDASVKTRSQLSDIDRTLAELEPQLAAAEATLSGAEIRATTDGRILSIAVRNAGDVVTPGEPILDIVPAARTLLVEARISPRDADDLSPGMSAEVRLVGVGGRMALSYSARVVRVSPDRLVDPRTNEAWFDMQLEVPDFKNSPDLAEAIRPGLPAEILVSLRKRSALDYLLEPLNQTLWRAMREQ